MTKLTEWDYVLKLTKEELNSVTIIHDNADFSGANCAIKFTIGLDKKYGNGVTYFGDTKLDCLKKAYNEYLCYLEDAAACEHGFLVGCPTCS